MDYTQKNTISQLKGTGFDPRDTIHNQTVRILDARGTNRVGSFSIELLFFAFTCKLASSSTQPQVTCIPSQQCWDCNNPYCQCTDVCRMRHLRGEVDPPGADHLYVTLSKNGIHTCVTLHQEKLQEPPGWGWATSSVIEGTLNVQQNCWNILRTDGRPRKLNCSVWDCLLDVRMWLSVLIPMAMACLDGDTCVIIVTHSIRL